MSDIRRDEQGRFHRDDSSLRDGLIVTNQVILDILALSREPFPSGRAVIAAGIETRVKRLIDELARIDAAPEAEENPNDVERS